MRKGKEAAAPPDRIGLSERLQSNLAGKQIALANLAARRALLGAQLEGVESEDRAIKAGIMTCLGIVIEANGGGDQVYDLSEDGKFLVRRPKPELAEGAPE